MKAAKKFQFHVMRQEGIPDYFARRRIPERVMPPTLLQCSIECVAASQPASQHRAFALGGWPVPGLWLACGWPAAGWLAGWLDTGWLAGSVWLWLGVAGWLADSRKARTVLCRVCSTAFGVKPGSLDP